MSSVKSCSRCICLVVVLAIGCNSKNSTTTQTGADVGAATEKGDAGRKSIIPVKTDVKELTGNWVVVVTNQGLDGYRWIIDFSQDTGGKIVAKFVDANHPKHDHSGKDEHAVPEIVETNVNGDAIKIVFKSSNSTFDFVGSFQNGFVRGTIRISPTELYLARLLPTDAISLEKFKETGLPPGADVFEASLKSKDFKPAEFMNTVRELKSSPLAQDMYSLLLSKHTEARFDEAKVKELIEDYLTSARIWGDRWEGRAHLTVAINLVNGHQFSQLVPAQLDAAEIKLGEDKDALANNISAYRDAATVQIKCRDILDSATSDAVKAAAYQELTGLLKTQRYNAEILYALGLQAERTDQIDAAIEHLSDVVAIPLLEATIAKSRVGEPPNPPNETLKKLWNKKHGNDDGYEQHIKEVYYQRIGELIADVQKASPAIPAVDGANRTVLVELFTGMLCGPCVAADLALEAIEKSYPHEKAVVVRYHQHIPAPDGMANPDSEERATFYEVNSTPTIIVDGIKIDPRFYSGPIQATGPAFGVFRQIIDSRLAEKTDVAIKLTANVNNGQLEASAEVTGIPEDVLPSCRLRLAVVENHVTTYLPLSTNGIRDHAFLVREILGGAKGIPPKNGELKYSSTMPVADLQQHLTNYITQFEAGRRLQFPNELKPTIQGPLSLVAWVQNGTPDRKIAARHVLQSVVVPITGETGFGAGPATTTATTAAPSATNAPTKPSEDVATQKREEPKPESENQAAVQNVVEAVTGDAIELTPPAPALPE